MTLSRSQKLDFLSRFGSIYEHSPWVAETILSDYDPLGLSTVEEMQEVMKRIVNNAGHDKKLTLLCAHPELAGHQAKEGHLTEHSTSEQKGAGLDQCSVAEYQELKDLNSHYKKKFNFPFIVAVKGLNKSDILTQFRLRIHNNPDKEFQTALNEVHKIAHFRLIQAMGD